MRILALWPRVSMIGLAIAVSAWLASVTNPWAAIGLWAAGAAVICGVVGFQMHAQKSGRVSAINHIAAWVLPWGIEIGRGKLLPIVIESWIRWVLLGIVIILAATRTFTHTVAGVAYRPGFTMTASVALSWMIDGAFVIRILTVLIMRAKTTPIAPGILVPIVCISLLLAASVVLWTVGHTTLLTGLALLLAGGPIVVFGGGYGLFVLLMVTFGRKMRWN